MDLLDTELHDNEADNTIEKDIQNKKYDIVIYGSYHRGGMPLYDLIMQTYKPSEVILLCGEDVGCCNKDHIQWENKGHTVFVREL